MKSLKESLFDRDLITKDIGVLTVIVNALENFIAEKRTDNQWIKTLNQLIDDIKYNTDFRKRHSMSYDKALNMKDDELYVVIDHYRATKQIILFGKGLYDLKPRFASAIVIRYSIWSNSIYADMYTSPTTDYKELVNNINFQYYRVYKDEVKLFNNFLDKIEQVF